ncbi:hypothetical protein CWI38_0004p0120 [Hamiltosporidium tvaerminnensis]|uniref:Uncharacterized protein n=1 Tax=Hamiltosporidium tvaerminnensis TaxID=1176355 RepID=A0A4Q9M2S1_9MICR|nr:hypothetical protein CWI38_0004p0120 [Hamiltosporidium tvaerminnensis]
MILSRLMNLYILLILWRTIFSTIKPIEKTNYNVDKVYEILCKEVYRQYRKRVLEMDYVFEYDFLILEMIPMFVDECDLEVFSYLYQKQLESTFLHFIYLIKDQDSFFELKTYFLFKIIENDVHCNTKDKYCIKTDSILYFCKKQLNFGILENFKKNRYVFTFLNRLLNYLNCIIKLMCKKHNIIIFKSISESQWCESFTLKNFLLSLLIQNETTIDCDYSILITKNKKNKISVPFNIANILKNTFTSMFYLDKSFSSLEKFENGALPPIFIHSMNHTLKIYDRNIVSFNILTRLNLFEINVSQFNSKAEKESKTKNTKYFCTYKFLNLDISIYLIKPKIRKNKNKDTKSDKNILKIVVKSLFEPSSLEFNFYYNEKNSSITEIIYIGTCENFQSNYSIKEKLNFILRYLNSMQTLYPENYIFSPIEKRTHLF